MKKVIKIVLTTAVTTMVIVSTSAKTIESKAEISIKNQVYFASQGKVQAVIAFSEANKQAALAAEEARIAKEKADALAIEKAKQDELDKQAADKKKEEDNAKALTAKQAEDSKRANLAAQKEKQAEIDRIQAERADKEKQAKILEQYRIEKAASDKAAADLLVARKAKIEQLKVARDAAIKSATEAKEKLVNDTADVLAKNTANNLAKEAADKLVNEITDKITKAQAAGTPVTEADQQAKDAAVKLAKAAADQFAKDAEAGKLLIAADQLAKAAADQLAKEATDKLAAAELGSFQTVIGAKLATFLSSSINISNVLVRAVELHNGDASNTCVYFSSEAMRRIGVAVPVATCNTGQYLTYLKAQGWVSCFDIKKLTPGSICFTTNDWSGHPTHTFAFLGWVKSGDYTLANVADNQGNTVHVRNMGATRETDAFAFFMHN